MLKTMLIKLNKLKTQNNNLLLFLIVYLLCQIHSFIAKLVYTLISSPFKRGFRQLSLHLTNKSY